MKISDYKKQKDQKIREAEAEREKYESRHKQLGQEIEARARYIVKETTDALIKEAESKEKERELILAETKVNYLAWTAAPHFLNFLLVLFGLTVSSAYVSEWIRVGLWLKKRGFALVPKLETFPEWKVVLLCTGTVIILLGVLALLVLAICHFILIDQDRILITGLILIHSVIIFYGNGIKAKTGLHLIGTGAAASTVLIAGYLVVKNSPSRLDEAGEYWVHVLLPVFIVLIATGFLWVIKGFSKEWAGFSPLKELTASYSYRTVDAVRIAQKGLKGGGRGSSLKLLEKLDGGYEFIGANPSDVTISTVSGDIINTFEYVEACYRNPEGDQLKLKISYIPIKAAAEAPTEQREIEAVPVHFDYYEYLHLLSENPQPDPSVLLRQKNDGHFIICHDGDSKNPVTTVLYRLSFEKDGVFYELSTDYETDPEDLFSIAEEMIRQKT